VRSSSQSSPDASPQADDDLDVLVTHAFDALPDLARARTILDTVSKFEGRRAEFAACLLTLELARAGEDEARAGLASRVGVLLDAFREPSLALELCGGHKAIEERFRAVAPLLAHFEDAEPEPQALPTHQPESVDPLAAEHRDDSSSEGTAEGSAPVEEGDPLPPAYEPPASVLDALFSECFASRKDQERLSFLIDSLAEYPGPRARFGQCIFYLELARLGVVEAQQEFILRAPSLVDSYKDPTLAARTIGDSAALRELWADLLPHLDEFFDTSGPPEGEQAESPLDEFELEVLEEEVEPLLETEGLDAAAETGPLAEVPPEKTPVSPPRFVPPPAAPPPFKKAETTERELRRRESGARARPRTLPPPPPLRDEAADDLLPATRQYSAFALDFLGRAPSARPTTGQGSFAAAKKRERLRLEEFAKTLITRFAESPQAHALACLTLLFVASKKKEKTLFGAPNMERLADLRLALTQLGGARAAGQAAVFFETDGSETTAGFGKVVDLVHSYLRFCLRHSLDPKSLAAVKRFTTP
jgi:hypothetical protein